MVILYYKINIIQLTVNYYYLLNLNIRCMKTQKGQKQAKKVC